MIGRVVDAFTSQLGSADFTDLGKRNAAHDSLEQRRPSKVETVVSDSLALLVRPPAARFNFDWHSIRIHCLCTGGPALAWLSLRYELRLIGRVTLMQKASRANPICAATWYFLFRGCLSQDTRVITMSKTSIALSSRVTLLAD